MAQIIEVFAVKTLDYHLYDQEKRGPEIKEEINVLTFSENEARNYIQGLIDRIGFSQYPLEYDKKVIEKGKGVCFTSVDPKRDGQCYKIWYEKREIVLT